MRWFGKGKDEKKEQEEKEQEEQKQEEQEGEDSQKEYMPYGEPWGRPGIDWLFILEVVALVIALGFLGRENWKRKMRVQQTIEELARRVEAEEKPAKEKAGRSYELVHTAIEENLPRMVFIGDEYTQGNQMGSVPMQFLRYSTAKLFGELNEKINPTIRKMNLESLRIPVMNQGVVDEAMNMVLVRFGGNQMLLGRDTKAPKGPDPIPMDFMDQEGNALLPARQNNVHFGLVKLEDLEGYFYSSGLYMDNIHHQLAFRPSVPLEEERVFTAGTELVLETQTAFWEDYVVLYFGNNCTDNGSTAPTLRNKTLEGEEARTYVEGIRRIVERRPEEAPPALVLGRAEEGSDLDRYYGEAFGSQYIRVIDKDIHFVGRDDCQDIAEQIYEWLEAQGKLDAIQEAVDEALDIWNKDLE